MLSRCVQQAATMLASCTSSEPKTVLEDVNVNYGFLVYLLTPPDLTDLPSLSIADANSDCEAFQTCKQSLSLLAGMGWSIWHKQLVGVILPRSAREVWTFEPFRQLMLSSGSTHSGPGNQGKTSTGPRSIRSVPLTQTEAVLPPSVGVPNRQVQPTIPFGHGFLW